MSLRISRRDPFHSYIENHRIPDSTESCQTHGLWLFVRSASNSLWPDSVREIRRVWYSKANGKVAWDILGDWKRMIGLNKVFGNSMFEASYQSSMPWKSEISSGCESHSVARPERNQGSEVGKDPSTHTTCETPKRTLFETILDWYFSRRLTRVVAPAEATECVTINVAAVIRLTAQYRCSPPPIFVVVARGDRQHRRQIFRRCCALRSNRPMFFKY